MKKLFLVFLVFVLVSGLVLSSSAKAASVQTLKIGALLSLTGWFTFEDTWDDGDLKIVAQMINDRGGLTIKGQKYNVEVVAEDCKSSFDGYTTAATKLVLDHKVKFVVGPNAFFSLASTPILEQNKVLHVSGYNTLQPGEMDANTPLAFLGYDSPVSCHKAGYMALLREFPKVKNVALFAADDASIKYTLPHLKNTLAKMGLNMVGDVVLFPNETTDYSPFVAKLNAISQADAYANVLASTPACGNILKGLRSLGNQKPVLVSTYAPDTVAIAGKEASHNAICLLSLTPNQPGKNPPLIDEAYKRGKPGRQWFGCAPNALWILAQVIQAADSLDPAVVKAKWESMDTVSTLYGKGTFGGDTTYGLKHHAVSHPLPYAKLVNGTVVDGGWIDPGPLP
jgi:branched-chain amino acid transport system substrate-binding protein